MNETGEARRGEGESDEISAGLWTGGNVCRRRRPCTCTKVARIDEGDRIPCNGENEDKDEPVRGCNPITECRDDAPPAAAPAAQRKLPVQVPAPAPTPPFK
ncbi:hypothetical protein ACLOJK_014130 [Asimina triloba]